MAECINREKAIAIIEEKQKELCPVGRYGRGYVYASDREKYDAWDEIIDALENIPNADVAPVVHGQWDGNDCTVCKLPWKYNMVQDADDWGYFDPMPDYCPNCGAKMDGGAENG